jgi:hypothetical protein
VAGHGNPNKRPRENHIFALEDKNEFHPFLWHLSWILLPKTSPFCVFRCESCQRMLQFAVCKKETRLTESGKAGINME